MVRFQDDHLLALQEARREFRRDREERAPKSGSGWFSSLNLDVSLRPPGVEHYTSKPNRKELFDLVADGRQDTVAVCASIMAWGGMRADHGRKLFTEQKSWRAAAEEIRFTGKTRIKAYSILSQQRALGHLPGMGPAYFTKLIFFLRGRDVADPGYIMDQWTGCSINLLTGNPSLVLMEATYRWAGPTQLRSDFRVSDQNCPTHYERFCKALDEVAIRVALDPIDAELLLMSEGRGRGSWRNYVIQNRQVPRMTTGVALTTNDDNLGLSES